MAMRQSFQTLFRSPLLAISDFRCPGYGCDSRGEEAAAAHSVAFVRRGAFVKNVGRLRTVVDSNHVALFNARSGYRISHLPDCGDHCTVVHPSRELLLEILAARSPAAVEQPDQPFARDAVFCRPQVAVQQWQVLSDLRAGRICDLDAENAVVELLQHALHCAVGGVPARRSGRRTSLRTKAAQRAMVEAAQIELASRFREPLGLVELAARVHTTPFHFCRVFGQHVGVSPAAYRTHLRLRAALERLAAGESDLTTLAMDLGFGDQSHFTNMFRARLGMTPGTFRRRCGSRQLRREMSKKLQVPLPGVS